MGERIGAPIGALPWLPGLLPELFLKLVRWSSRGARRKKERKSQKKERKSQKKESSGGLYLS